MGHFKISIVTPCYNEQDNVCELAEKVRSVLSNAGIDYEHIFLDNASTDGTLRLLEELAAKDERIKVIVNNRNFGHIRSPYYGLLQANGDAAILLVADFQDPPDLLPEFVRLWRDGSQVVIGIKTSSKEPALMYLVRSAYYEFINRISDTRLPKNFTGFGLYDRKIIEVLRGINDPYPYLRGLVFEFTDNYREVPYSQPIRRKGITKNNFFTLYDLAMLGICNHSKIPLRVATIGGFLLSFLSILIAVGYMVAKLLFWNSFSLGIAPVLIGLFFFSSVLLFFLGILGEYIGFLVTKASNRPLVIERRRINF